MARKDRKTNTHDPSASERRFNAAVKAADRDLTDASLALQRNAWNRSITLLVRASYWLGQARSERRYAARIDPKLDKRLKTLEKGMERWGKNFMDTQREAQQAA